MNRRFLLLISVSLFAVTGCDFFRTLAGRPTSGEIEERKIEMMRAEQAVLQARIDSLRQEQQAMRDSLDALDSIRQYGGSVLNPAMLGGLFATRLNARYYVIVGAFRVRANAESLFRQAKDRGYEPALISFNNGMIAVGLCPCATVVCAMQALKRIKAEDFCPKDVWVLLNE